MPIIGRPELANALKPIPIQQNYIVVKSNDLIQQSRFTLTLQQNKILLFLISKIRPTDTGNEVYSFSVREFCKVCNICCDSGENYAKAQAALKALADKSIWVKQPNGDEVLIRWFNRVKLNKKAREFEVTFHEDMLPYLYELQSKYTSYCLSNVLTMNSIYAIRLYELLKSYESLGEEISFTLDELRKRLDAEKYKRYSDFKRFALEKALEEINTNGDIHVEYVAYSSSNRRSVDYITFTIKEPGFFDGKQRKRTKNRKLTPSGKEEYKKRLMEIEKLS